MRPGLGDLPARQDGGVGWYGSQAWWQLWVEAGARAEHGTDLLMELQRTRLTYRVPVEVRGRLDRVLVRIDFHRWPPYDCYGLPPEEYPRVYAAPGASSPHRMPQDQALCLFFPQCPPWRRWRPSDGLLALIDLARDHIFFEDYWRATGGGDGGVWLGAQGPHGFPEGSR